MQIAGLDHYALLCTDPERTVRFYCDVVGLKAGPRPDLSFPGAWLYAGSRPIVHIIFGKPIPTKDTGAVDHLAFVAKGNAQETISRLTNQGIVYTSRLIERTGVTQVFFRD